MKSALLLAGLFVFGVQVYAAAPIQLTGADIAEFVALKATRAPTMQKWVEESGMTKAHQEQVQSYLTLHHLDRIQPNLKWKSGSSAIEIADGDKYVAIDFSEFPSTKHVKFNGNIVDAESAVYFTDVIKKFKNARSAKKSAAFQVFLSDAYADDPLHSVVGAIAYWTGLDQLTACTEGESYSISLCAFGSNASNILAALDKGDRITAFQCDTHGIKSIKIDGRYPLSLTADHDNAGNLSSVKTSQSGFPTCTYLLSNGKITSAKLEDSTEAYYCEAQTLGTYDFVSHNLRPGERPRQVGKFPIPLPRLEQCCKDTVCIKDMAAIVQKANQKSSKQKTGSIK